MAKIFRAKLRAVTELAEFATEERVFKVEIWGGLCLASLKKGQTHYFS